jgi:hypothetical protein
MIFQAIHRRGLLVSGAAALLASSCARAANPKTLVVYKTPSCGCCKGWVAHMTRAGFTPTIHELEDLAPVRARYGVPFKLSSCHTGVIGGYVIEGHVPADDVARLLRERPKALGLTAPGMPIGSPGMEVPDRPAERFDTLLLLDRSGRTQVFATHGA